MLLGVLLVLGSLVLFAMTRFSPTGNTPGKPGTGNGSRQATATVTVTTPANGTTPTVTATPSTPPQAGELLQQYYSYISSKDYQAASNLWKPGPNKPSVAALRKKYRTTQQVTVAIDSSTQFADGSVQLSVTVTATENRDQGTQTVTYKGFYKVGPQNDGTWRITQESLNQI
jgi:hypothetical protein